MEDLGRSRMTLIVTAAVIIIICTVPSVCAFPLSRPPGNISQVQQTKEFKNPGDCLPNQYFIFGNFTCGNCTYCSRGTEHFPHGQCGNGHGVRATCRPCPEGFYQTEEGYSDVTCRRCVKCDEKAEVLQQCSPTQNRECGACPSGTYAFTPNVCVDCSQDPTQSACARPTPSHNSSTSQSAPEPPSLISPPVTTPLPAKTVLSSQSSSQTQNTSISYGESTTKFSVFGVMIAVVVTLILICAAVLGWWGFQGWKTLHNSGSQNPLPVRKQQPTQFPNASYTNVPTGDNILTTTSGQESPLPTPDNEKGRTPEEAVALLPEGKPTGDTTTTTHETEVRQGAGVPVSQPATLQSVLPSNTEFSVPGQLSSNGGPGGDGVYQHHRNNEPRSLDSAKDNSTSEGDDDTLSLPGQLRS